VAPHLPRFAGGGPGGLGRYEGAGDADHAADPAGGPAEQGGALERRLWHTPAPIRLRLRLCEFEFSETKDEVEITWPSSPDMQPIVTKIDVGVGETWETGIYVLPVPPPTQVAIRVLGDDALCIQSATINGVPLAGRASHFPLWLDNPCEDTQYNGAPCETFSKSQFTLVVTETSTTSTTVTSTSVTTSTTTTATTSSTVSTTSSTSTGTSTTTTSSTSTRTSTTTVSTTVSTSTSSTTRLGTSTTTTTTTPSPIEAFGGALLPDAFNDVFKATMTMNIFKEAIGGGPLQAQAEIGISKIIAKFTGVRSPSTVKCKLEQTLRERALHLGEASSNAKAVCEFDVKRDSLVSVAQMHKMMEDPGERPQLNRLLVYGPDDLEDYNMSKPLTLEEEQGLELCDEHGFSCCVNSVVYSILHNAGLTKAYRHYFIMSMTLVLFVCVTLARVLRKTGFFGPGRRLGEKMRGYIVIPLLFAGDVFEAMVYLIKAIEKYMMLLRNCEKKADLGAACPPSPWGLTFEVSVFVVLLLAPLVYIVKPLLKRWRIDIATENAPWEPPPPSQVKLGLGTKVDLHWGEEWLRGVIKGTKRSTSGLEEYWAIHCDRDDPQVLTYARADMVHRQDTVLKPRTGFLGILQQRHVMPLESVLRRCFLVAFMEVRKTDKTSAQERFFIVLMNMLLSFAVVNTAFFALQRYEVPGKLAAWLPYKLILELVVAGIIKATFSYVMSHGVCGRRSGAFAAVSISGVVAVNVYMWIQIGTAVESFVEDGDLGARLRVLDITVGAGLINFLLSPLVLNLQLLTASVYAYEPCLRQKVYRCVYLRKPEQVVELLEAVGQGDRGGGGDVGRWQIRKGTGPTVNRKPVRIAGLDDETIGRLLQLDDEVDKESKVRSLRPLQGQVATKRKRVKKAYKRLVKGYRRHEDDEDEDEDEEGKEGEAGEEEEDEEDVIPEATPSDEAPVLVQLQNADAGRCKLFLVRVLDLVLSVDRTMPVTRHQRQYRGPPDDSDFSVARAVTWTSPAEAAQDIWLCGAVLTTADLSSGDDDGSDADLDVDLTDERPLAFRPKRSMA